MKFEISKVEYDGGKTMPVFDEVFYEDDLLKLQKVVEEESVNRRGRIVKVDADSIPFKVQNPEGIEMWVKYIYPIPRDETKIISRGALEKKDYIESVEPDENEDVVYRPYKNIQEMLNDGYTMNAKAIPPNARPLVWVCRKHTGDEYLINGFCTNGVMIDAFYTYEELFEQFEYLNGLPCGVRE